ncbi:hypothetical protein DFQ28_004251 [Apophysomyces sp. BC1034]|nr:hypothetical protein DFQ30_004237 [Apophysomyces sp. BC1015]KAG0177788.1 hypothetical protein DFQ29_004339 [Apophysomyces sp. BC1021]KAG0188847.1 hypothetical protein DFQ28_004251 [Apophysomyces sp. BC1034]
MRFGIILFAVCVSLATSIHASGTEGHGQGGSKDNFDPYAKAMAINAASKARGGGASPGEAVRSTVTGLVSEGAGELSGVTSQPASLGGPTVPKAEAGGEDGDQDTQDDEGGEEEGKGQRRRRGKGRKSGPTGENGHNGKGPQAKQAQAGGDLAKGLPLL